MDAAKRFAVLAVTAGMREKPKLHLLMHVPLRAFMWGSPAQHATWADESLNKTLASIGGSAHRVVWGVRMLENFEQHQQRKGSKRSRE